MPKLMKPTFTVALAICAVFSQIKTASSQTYNAGRSSTGQTINVDLGSISRASYRSVNFVYYQGEDRIESQANCETGTWTTFPEREVHRPQSQATQNMLNVVCRNARASNPASNATTAVVFDPPSNVRTEPGGDILCSVRSQTAINIYGSTGSWYYTDACGRMGVINSSQIRF
jgi:hypothetical protein